jgi:hypothetical protein
MFGHVFRRLLLLLLLLNGAVPPSVLAFDAEPTAARAAAATVECPMHDARTTPAEVADVAPAPDAGTHDDCCDAGGCDCGCMQAHMMLPDPFDARAAFTAAAPGPWREASSGQDRRHPPLRPPSA